jgi:branched-chain amino acid transport system permease protein
MQSKDSSSNSGYRQLMDRLSITPLGACGLALLLLLPMIPPFNQDYLIRWLIAAAIVGGLAVAFDFSAGYLGIVNFGFAAFVGLGGYASAIVSNRFGITPFVTIFIGALFSGILGVLTGIVSLRLRGMFAICFTWFIGLAIMGLAIKWEVLTRGPLGLRCAYFFEGTSSLPFYYMIIGLMFATYLLLSKVIRSYYGLAFRCIGQNLASARTSGIRPTRYRVINFTLSSMFAGLLGGFYAHYYGILTPEVMHTQKTVEVLAIAYVGGRGSLWGGMAAAFPFIFGLEFLRSTFSNLPGINLIIYGTFLILIMIYYPGGLAHFFKSRILQRKRKAAEREIGGPLGADQSS